MRSKKLHWQNSIFRAILISIVLLAGCKAPVDPSASATSYARLLNTDAPSSLSAMRASADGNLLFLYTAQVPGDSTTSIELTKTDANGNVIWTHHYGDSGTFAAGDCTALPNGDIAIAGQHQLSAKNFSILYMLVDGAGNIITNTSKEFLSLGSLRVTTIVPDDSGNLVIGSYANDPLATNSEKLVMVRVTPSGTFLDSSSCSPGTSTAYGITQMSSVVNGLGIIAGWKSSGGYPASSFFTWKRPDTTTWIEQIIPKNGILRTVARLTATTFVVAGDSAGYGQSTSPAAFPNGWIEQLSFVANKWDTIRARTITAGQKSGIVSVIQTANGEIAATGFSVSATNDTSIAIFRFNAKNNDVWPYKLLRFSGGDVPSNIVELQNGDLVIGGITTSFGNRASGARQLFLIHLHADGTPAS